MGRVVTERNPRPAVDFGRSVDDYVRHRPGFPDLFFDRVATLGVGLAGQRVADLGTGTGTLARGFARRGCRVVGVDASRGMLGGAVELDRRAGVTTPYLHAVAEATGLVADAFDAVTAGQCWHWFDRPRAAAEARRLLRAGGHAVIARMDYLPEPGELGGLTEELVLARNPGWPMAGTTGRHPQFAHDLSDASFAAPEIFEVDFDVSFSHEAWRGRMRACNGVLTMPAADTAAFDADLAALLARRFPDPVTVPHRIYGIVARRPR
jgi:SAM-dependent methyltransferase